MEGTEERKSIETEMTTCKTKQNKVELNSEYT
jgi:hypothetical protein